MKELIEYIARAIVTQYAVLMGAHGPRQADCQESREARDSR